METKTLIDLGNVLAIILSIVSLIVTTIGFFASLKFYNDGVKLQNSANDALVRIEEKALTIQSQVGGMFDKTLDAAIGKSEKLNISFEALNEQLELTAKAIIDNAQKKIGATGDEERRKLSIVVAKQMDILKASVEETREKAVKIAESPSTIDRVSTTDFGKSILEIIKKSDKPLSVEEISKYTGVGIGYTSAVLNRLYYGGFIIREQINGLPHYRINV